MGAPTACHPVQSSFSCSGLRFSPMSFSIAVISRHFPDASQYFPLPYSDSSDAAISLISFRNAGSFGPGAVNESFSRRNFRARSDGRCNPSNRLDCSTSSVVTAVISSFVFAASASVSSVMKLSCTQFAWLPFTLNSPSRASAFFMNASASGTVGSDVWAATTIARAKKQRARRTIIFIRTPGEIMPVRCADLQISDSRK